jgi:hypothetical protein
MEGGGDLCQEPSNKEPRSEGNHEKSHATEIITQSEFTTWIFK